MSHCAQGFLSLLCMVLEGSCPIVRMSQCCMVLKGSCVVWWSRLQVLYGPQEILVHTSMILTGKGSGLVYFSRGFGLFFMIKSHSNGLQEVLHSISFEGSCVVSSYRFLCCFILKNSCGLFSSRILLLL